MVIGALLGTGGGELGEELGKYLYPMTREWLVVGTSMSIRGGGSWEALRREVSPIIRE